MPINDEKKLGQTSETPDKIRDHAGFCHYNCTEIPLHENINASKVSYKGDIDMTVKEIRNISSAIRRASVVMPELLRLIRQHGINEELIGVIDELAYAVHDTTLAIRTVTRGLN